MGPYQTNFLKGCRACGNAILVHEIMVHVNQTKDSSGSLMLKIDLEKTFDRLEWSFVNCALWFFKFPPKIMELIMNFITSSNIAVLVNGTQTDFFLTSRGIHQRDPMSPYVLILCMELLSTYINHQEDILSCIPITLHKNGPNSCSSFFMDDLTLVAKAKPDTINTMCNCLNNFWRLSRQNINSSKSKVSFSRNYNTTVRRLIKDFCNINPSIGFGKYLGFPILNHKTKPSDFQYILDNMKKKLSIWKTNFLSPIGRLTLIKSTFNAIPAYGMQYFDILATTCKSIDKI